MTEWAKWYGAMLDRAAVGHGYAEARKLVWEADFSAFDREMRKAQRARDEAELAEMYGMEP